MEAAEEQQAPKRRGRPKKAPKADIDGSIEAVEGKKEEQKSKFGSVKMNDNSERLLPPSEEVCP